MSSLLGVEYTNQLVPVDVFIDGLGDSNGGPIRNNFSELPSSFYTAPTLAYVNDARLSGAIIPLLAPFSATFTVTIATPGVITQNGHGLQVGDPVVPTTSGALPTGYTAGTEYYVTNRATNTYQLATTIANALAGTGIATSGSQSGTHTMTALTGVQQQSDIYAVDSSANTWHTSTGGNIEYMKERRIDSVARQDFFGATRGSSRFSDAGAGVRLTNWDASLNDGAFNVFDTQWAAYVVLLAAQGNRPNVTGIRISGPANGVVDNTETAAFGTQLTAAVARLRTKFGNTFFLIIERMGNATNQAAFASNAANVATIRAAQKSVVDAEIAAGRPAALVNADGFIAADSPTLHWSAATHAIIKETAYSEIYNKWYPQKYSEAIQPSHMWRFGDPRNLPVPATGALQTAFDFVDFSINPTQGTVANQPAISTAALANGYPTCRTATGDGTNDIILGTGAAININADFGFWAVVKAPSTASKCFFGVGGLLANPFIQIHSAAGGTGNLCVSVRDDLGTLTTLDFGLVAWDNAYHFIAVWRDGNNWYGRVDGTTSSAQVFNPGTTTLTKTSFFAANNLNGTAGNWMNAAGRIAITTAVKLNTTYCDNARIYCQRRWGAP
jgi:hypothetical protein